VSARLKSLSPRALAVIGGAAVLVYAAALWFLFVSPSRSDAASAKEELASAELRLVEAQSATDRPSGANAPVADVFRLSKAMPVSTDQSGLVLELSKLASRSGVRLQGMTQQPEVAAEGGPSLIPVSVTVDGTYRQITKFLRLTRGLVTVRNGKIHARGRLLAVQSVALSEAAAGKFPRLDATIALSAYVYDEPIVPPEVPEPETEELPTPDSTALGSTN
jgi:Tfp pilus assembly protein PilO